MTNSTLLTTMLDAAPDYVCPGYDVDMLMSLASQLEASLRVSGDVVLYGCPEPLIAAWFSCILKEAGSDKLVYVFEPFAIEPVVGGKCMPVDISKVSTDTETGSEDLMNLFESKELTCPEIVAGWFCETADEATPSNICFVHINCAVHNELLEAYLSSYTCLNAGARVCVQWYGSGHNPCIRTSTDEFLFSKPEAATVILHNAVGQYAMFEKQADIETESYSDSDAVVDNSQNAQDEVITDNDSEAFSEL